ncbi:MAG: hypothetical protein ACLVDO_08095 [Streptococcus thermophilus]
MFKRIPSTTLTADLTNLDYYKPYTLTTTMTFDRGNGEESGLGRPTSN